MVKLKVTELKELKVPETHHECTSMLCILCAYNSTKDENDNCRHSMILNYLNEETHFESAKQQILKEMQEHVTNESTAERAKKPPSRRVQLAMECARRRMDYAIKKCRTKK